MRRKLTLVRAASQIPCRLNDFLTSSHVERVAESGRAFCVRDLFF
jgi:hypothetical protein